MKRNVCCGLLALLIFLWAAVGFWDYWQVSRFEKPDFCIPIQTWDDGGSRTYRGLGYRFEIEGNFMPEDEYHGVTYYAYFIFGIPVQQGLRD